jgi:flagellar protein FliO/FliZ
LFLRQTALLTVSPGKSVQVITLGEEAYLIGVADNGITLLGKISDKDLIDAMNLNAEKNRAGQEIRNFSSLLSVFMGKNQQKPKGPRASFSASMEQTENFFRVQRSRLRRVDTPEEFPFDQGS